MDALMEQVVADERFRATLAACFGGAALLLAAIGLYGLASRRVLDRRREFAVRVALGAAPANIGGLILKDALVIIAAGLLAGLPAAYAASRLARTMLFGVSPGAPHVFALATGELTESKLDARVKRCVSNNRP
jgi:ABC-type antimicrobial peptide transport system permease subunit